MNAKLYVTYIAAILFFNVLHLRPALADSSKINPHVFKMWLGAGIPEMQTYDQAVVERALEFSRDKYGNFEFQTEAGVASVKRQERVYRASREIAINTSPPNDFYSSLEDGSYALLRTPFAKGMLGYRQLLVSASRAAEFSSLASLSDLQRMSIGQVEGWADIKVLQSNEISVSVVQQYELLFPMLLKNRFDAISVGSTEVPALLNMLEIEYPNQFFLVPDLVVFYPFSLFIFINTPEPKAVERLQYGYDRALARGEIDRLFEQFHGGIFEALKSPNLKIITLDNPYQSARGAERSPILLQ